MFCGIVVVAILHGLIFVPAILGELRCIYDIGSDEKSIKSKQFRQKSKFTTRMAIGGNTVIEDDDLRSEVTGMTAMTAITNRTGLRQVGFNQTGYRSND